MSARVAASRSARGFTLIELLVAVTVVSLALVAVSPALNAGVDRAAVYAARAEFESQIRDLRWRALLEQREIVIAEPAPGAAAPVALPPGFRYRLPEPIVIAANGSCSGGLARVEKSARVGMDLRLAPHTCAVERLDAARRRAGARR